VRKYQYCEYRLFLFSDSIEDRLDDNLFINNDAPVSKQLNLQCGLALIFNISLCSQVSNPDSGYDAEHHECPASPTTIPNMKPTRSNSSGSQVKSPKPRRQRTTSVNTNTISSNEAIIRSNNRTIYTAGRPPWYNSQGQQVEPFVIGICGGSASGKTTVAQKIIESLDVPWVTLLSMDCFYRILNQKQHEQAQRNEYNFDHPDAFDLELMAEVLQRLKEGKKVEVPVYNFVTHSRELHTVNYYQGLGHLANFI
jgi:hypothetical protein